MAQGLAPRARRALPRGVHHLHGALRRDRRDDHARGRQDHPRVARGDGRLHGRPLPPRLRGHAPLRRQGASLHPGALERQAHRRHAGADRRRRGGHALELPGRHRRDPDRLRPRGRLHRRLEAVGARAALRQHVRRGHPRRRLPRRDAQRRARPRRCRLAARAPSRCRLRRLHRAPRTRASRSRATPPSRTACSSWAATGRRSSSPTRTSTRPPTRPSSAASTSPASAARPPSASSCTSP